MRRFTRRGHRMGAIIGLLPSGFMPIQLAPLVYVANASEVGEPQATNESVVDVGCRVTTEGKANLSSVNQAVYYGSRRRAGEDKARIWQYSDNGTQAQRWRAIKNSDGSITLRSVLAPSLVLDVSGGIAASQANVQVFEQNSTAAQNFYFERVE